MNPDTLRIPLTAVTTTPAESDAIEQKFTAMRAWMAEQKRRQEEWAARVRQAREDAAKRFFDEPRANVTNIAEGRR